MTTWLDKMLYRVRDAATVDEARIVVRDYMDPNTGAPMGDNGDDGGDQHIHVHLGGGSEGGGDPSGGDMNGGNGGGDPMGGGGGSVEDRLSQLEQMVQKLMSGNGGGEEEDDGEDVELEDPDTKDARRFRMRRGKSLKVRDEEALPTPEHRPEMMGETDLPGIEDLDAKMPTGDKMRRYRSGDSADMEVTWADTMAAGKIILPSIRIPTFDARLTPMRTATRLCAFRRQTLDAALKDETASKIIQEVVGIKTTDGIACDSIKMAFNATSAAMRAHNNGSQFRRTVDTKNNDSGNGFTGPITLGEIQRRNREAWKSGEFKTS